MQIHGDISHLPEFNHAVATIGTFDGVHYGHREILEKLVTEAKQVNGEAVVITFHPHPRKILSSASGPLLLNTLSEKIGLLSGLGIDHLVVVPFNKEFAALTARQYAEDFLIKKIQPHTLIIGYDHHFGHDREGNFSLLAEYAAQQAFRLVQIPEKILENIAISSTRIRNALKEGNIVLAAELLGYDYFFSGEVVHGNKKGRTIGFPTANIQLGEADKLTPGNGVYAVTATRNGVVHPGMMNIGFRPTAGGSQLTVEVHLLDFDADIYGETLTISLKRRLRSEQKFASFDELKTQLQQDKEWTAAFFSRQ
jgi:riboflavin kinase / FMN adenylyltransferase